MARARSGRRVVATREEQVSGGTKRLGRRELQHNAREKGYDKCRKTDALVLKKKINQSINYTKGWGPGDSIGGASKPRSHIVDGETCHNKSFGVEGKPMGVSCSGSGEM